MAFKIAASKCLSEGVRMANPQLLEPMMAVEIVTPEELLLLKLFYRGQRGRLYLH
jgi:elongation factor G